MTGEDRDRRIAELLERHTPVQDRTPEWSRVERSRRPVAARLLAASGVAAIGALIVVMLVVAPDGTKAPAPPGVASPAPRAGTPVPLPGALAPFVRADRPGGRQTGLRPGTVRRVLTLRRAYGTWVLWTALNGSGTETAYLLDPREGSVVPPIENCRLTPAQPDLRTCRVGDWYSVGRAGDRVARIVPGGAVVRNGWFLALLPKSSPAPVVVSAVDAGGAELGRVQQAAP